MDFISFQYIFQESDKLTKDYIQTNQTIFWLN